MTRSRHHYTILALTLLHAGACSNLRAEAADTPRDDARPGNVSMERDGLRVSAPARPHVEVAAVAYGNAKVTIRSPARVAFRDNAVSRVGAPIPARVMRLHVQVGERVQVGTELATLASPDASGFHAEAARAKVELAAALDLLRRQEDMIARGVGREYERVSAQMRVRDAEERLIAAKRDVALLGKSSGGTVVVTSQIAGTVLRRHASIGAQVDPDGDPLFEIGNPNDLWIVADVFQDDLNVIAEGAPVTIDVASQQASLEGRVASIGASLESNVRRAPIYIDVAPADVAKLRAGMFASALIHSDTVDRMTLPVSAILVKNGSQTVVYVENASGTFTARPIQLGHTFGERVEVVSGLKVGEKVAIKGALLLDGAANQLL